MEKSIFKNLSFYEHHFYRSKLISISDLYLKKMSEVIDSIDPTKSSFVYFAPQHVHYPLQALEKYLTKYEWILDYNRRRYAAMVSALDEMIGDVVKLYDQKGLLQAELKIS